MTSGTLEAVDRILNRGEPDALAQVVTALHGRGVRWVAVVLPDGSRAAAAGEPVAAPALRFPISRAGRVVAHLEAEAGDAARPLLERVALLVSPHVPA